MFGFLGRLFGSQEAGKAIIDNVSDGIDKLWYTDEEKAEAAAQARTEGMKVYMKWLESTSGSRLARRIIALLVTGMWAVQQVLGQLFSVIAVFLDDTDRISRLNEASVLLFQYAQENNTLVGVVLLFYFGGPAAMEGVKGMVQKWVNK